MATKATPATPEVEMPNLEVQITLPDGYFKNLRALWEESQKKADAYKKQHDQTLDIMLRINAPVPEGTERIEKRGRPAKEGTVEVSLTETTESAPEETPAA